MTDAQKAAGHCRHHGCVFVSTPPLFTSLFMLASGCDPQASTDLLHPVRPTREAVAAHDRDSYAGTAACSSGQRLTVGSSSGGIRICGASLDRSRDWDRGRDRGGWCEKMNSPFAWGRARTRP